MIIHADNVRGQVWNVIHIPTGSKLEWVIWVNDETAQYEEYLRHNAWCICRAVRQAKRIKIIEASHLVLIDPLDDEDMMAPGTEELDQWIAEDVHY